MQSGITGYKEYRNTDYFASYMRRHVLEWDITLYKNSVRNRFRCEALPIGLGYAGGNTTGWLDGNLDEIDPNGSSGSFQAIYNRTVVTSLRRRGVVEAKLKMLESKLDLAESLVDIDKTVMLVVERATQVLLAWTYMRKGKTDKALQVLGLTKHHWTNPNSIADMWLEIQYGWLPLLNDIFGAVEATKDLFGDPLAHHTYVKRRVRESLWLEPRFGDSSYWEKTSQEDVSLCEVETKFRFRVEDALSAYLAGFQLTNPLYVVWVAVPFTFVVDWILPIGDWLGSLTATFGLKFVDGYQTTKTFGSVTVGGKRKQASSPAYWNKVSSLAGARSRVERGFIVRQTYSSWPMSLTYFKFPFTSPQRIASAIALTQVTAGLR
jgi:hypothetical protein